MKTPTRSPLYHDHAPLRTHTPNHNACQPRQTPPPRAPITSTAILKAVLNGLMALQIEEENAAQGLPPTSDPPTQRLLTSTRAFLRKNRLHKAGHAAMRAGASPADPDVTAAHGADHVHWWQGARAAQGQGQGQGQGQSQGQGQGHTHAHSHGGRDVLREVCPGCKGMRTVKAYCVLQLKVAIAEEDPVRIRAIQGAIRELDK